MIDRDQHVPDLIAAYVLDAVTPFEARIVEEHLAVCAQCRAEERELREAVAYLADAAGETQPSAGLKSRVMSHVRQSERAAPGDQPAAHTRSGRVEPPGSPAPSRRGVSRRGDLRELRGARQMVRALAVAAILLIAAGVAIWRAIAPAQPAPRIYSIAGAATQPAIRGTLSYTAPSKTVHLSLHGLRPLPDGRVYELWLVRTRGGKPVSAAPVKVFRPGAGGDASLTARGWNVPAYSLAGLTVEKAPGARTPTFPIVAAAKIS